MSMMAWGVLGGTHPGPRIKYGAGSSATPFGKLRTGLRGGEFFYPLLGGVLRSSGVGFLVVTCPEPTPALRATPPERGWEEERARCPRSQGGGEKGLFYPLLGGVLRSSGVGLTDGRLRNPPRPTGHPSREGMVQDKKSGTGRNPCLLVGEQCCTEGLFR